MHNATKWSVVLSDTETRQHWLFDGGTAILHICLACIGSDDIPYTDAGTLCQILFPSTVGTPNAAYDVLISRCNRSISLQAATSSAEPRRDSPAEDVDVERFENLALMTWQRLELMHDRAQQRDTSERFAATLKAPELTGFEFNDLVEGQTVLRPGLLRLDGGATPWTRICWENRHDQLVCKKSRTLDHTNCCD